MKTNWVFNTALHFPFKNMSTLRNKRKLAAAAGETPEKILRTASHETRPFLEITRNILQTFLERLKAELPKNGPKSSVGQSPAFWVLWINQTNFSWTHRYERTPEPFREHSGTQTWKTRERMRTTPRKNLILKQASSAARLHKILARKLATTRWHEFRKRVSAAMIVIKYQIRLNGSATNLKLFSDR